MTIKGEVTARPQVFAAAVKWAAKFLDSRPSVPIQGGLLLEIEDGMLTVTAMNENVSAVATLPVEGIGAGRVVVSGRLLNELVGTFPDRPVIISGVDGDDASLGLTAGRWKGTLPTMAEADFPDQPEMAAIIGTVNGEAFARAVAEAAVATSKDPDRPTQWRSVHLDFDADVRIVGTDSYRMAGTGTPFTIQDGDHEIGETGRASALVLAQPMVDVSAGFIGPDEIEVGLNDSAISMASRTRSVVLRQARVLGGEYPLAVVTGVLATEQPDHAVVRVADLAGPLKRAALVRDKDGPVAVGFSAGTISIAAKADQLKQEGSEDVDAEYSGPEIVFHFNPKYFAEALASAPGDRVDIAITEKTGAGGRPGAVVLTVPDTAWRHVLMPVKV
jgi:DNA polymerase-3 subunit beta